MAAGPVAAAGLDGNAPVSISLRVKDARGAAVCPFHDPPGLYVERVKAVLERTAGGPRDSVDAWLTRASGTEQDGTWTGQWRAGSTRSGTWSLVRVEWCVLDGDNERTTQVVPSPIRSVVVTGSQAPRLTWRRVPAVAAYNARQWVEYTVRDATGHRLAGLPITLGHIYPAAGDSDSWSGCGYDGNGDALVATDGQGRVVQRLTMMLANTEFSAASRAWVHPHACLYLARPASTHLGDLVGVTVLTKSWLPPQYMTYASVIAAPKTASAPAGRRSTVSGVLVPAGVWKVALQRRVSGHWVTVRTVLSTAKGRYTVATHVLARGSNVVRVVARGGPLLGAWGQHSGRVLAPTPSRVLVITGT